MYVWSLLFISTECIIEACVFYPKLPRSWIPDGIILVPSLNEKGVKGAFELDVYASGSLLTIHTQ